MANPSIVIDLVESSSYQYAWNGTYMQEQATRIATVKGLGSGTMDAANAISLARATVQKVYPIAQRYPNGLKAIVFGYEVEGVYPDLVKIKIIYDTPYGAGTPPGGGSPFVISDTTSIERITTGFCPGPKGTRIQTVVWWQNPNNKRDNVVWPGTFSYDITLRTVTATGVVSAAKLAAYQPFANYVNQNPWNGLGVAYWKLNGIQSSTLDLGKNYTVQIQAQADTSKDWSQWINGRNPNAANRVIVIQPKDMNDLSGMPYAPLSVINIKNPVGVIRACPYPWTDFRSIFGFG